MLLPLDEQWKEWITTNVARGCDRDELTRILLEHGFNPLAIVNEMQYMPQSPDVLQLMQACMAGKPMPEQPTEDAASVHDAYAAIDAVDLAGAVRVPSDKVHMYTVASFLSAEECAHLIALIRQRCHPSTITSQDEPDKAFRTSQTCDLALQPEDWVQALDKRMAAYMGMEAERAEGIQGQYYQVGQQFKTHTDYFQPDTEEYRLFAGTQGQRTWTFMIYLNDVIEGGETVFPHLELSLRPQQGSAVIWNSLHPNGVVNPHTAHWAKPVLQGEKYVITKWFRTMGSLRTPFQRG